MAERTPTKDEIDANVKKTLAEAALADASAKEKLAAADQHVADIDRMRADLEHTNLLIKHSGIENRIAEIALAKCEREEDYAKVSDIFHQTFNFDSSVNSKSVKECINTLTAWSRQAPGCDITLYINSPGGDIIDGFALIDFLLELRRQGHKITTVALGMAASMGGVLLQAGDVRVMGANAVLLIHEGSLGAIGSFGEVEDHLALMTALHNRILALFESRATPINPKTTAAYIKGRWKRKDWWITSEEAVKLGFVDESR